MSFFLGIDLGASALKLSLIDAHAQYVGGCSMGLATHTSEPGHAEQNPADWRAALQSGLGRLHADFPTEVQALRAIVFTGGAHIAVLCDERTNPCARPLCGATSAPRRKPTSFVKIKKF